MWIFTASLFTGLLSACTTPEPAGADHDLFGAGQASALVTAPAGGGGLGSAWVVGTGALQPLTLEGGIQDLFWAGDVDRDGRWELLVQSQDRLHLARVGAQGLELIGPAAPGSHAVYGDVDGDGHSDQLFLAPGGLMFARSGAVDQAVPVEAPSGLMAMELGDLDGDGRAEWVGLELQQGPAGVQAVLLTRAGTRSGLGDLREHPLPTAQVPAWMHLMTLDGQPRVVFGMPDGPLAFSFREGKLRPEPATGLPPVATRELLIWQGQPLSWREDGVYLGETRLEGPTPDSGLVVRDLRGDGQPILVWSSRSRGQVGALDPSGKLITVDAPPEPAPFPPGRLILDAQGQPYVQWRERLFSLSGEQEWEGAPVARLDSGPNPRHLETDWGSLDWTPAGEVTWTDTSGQTQEVLQGTGGAMDIAVQGNQGVALGVAQGRLTWFRFSLGPEGPGLAQEQPPPLGGLSFFGASLR